MAWPELQDSWSLYCQFPIELSINSTWHLFFITNFQYWWVCRVLSYTCQATWPQPGPAWERFPALDLIQSWQLLTPSSSMGWGVVPGGNIEAYLAFWWLLRGVQRSNSTFLLRGCFSTPQTAGPLRTAMKWQAPETVEFLSHPLNCLSSRPLVHFPLCIYQT